MIHSTAIVDKNAILADNVEVGPYCLIGPGVKIGAGTKFGPHCVIHKDTAIGKNNRFTAFCSIGADPQDLKYKGEKTFLEIGDNNTIREYVTFNRATGEANKTAIGSDNLFMANCHIAHNCIVGNNAIIANAVLLGGHVTVEEHVVMGGMSGAHQFCRIGRFAIVGGCSKVVQDIPPYSMCDGNPAKVCGLNKIGLGRAGISSKTQLLLKKAFKILFAEGLLISNAVKKVEVEIAQANEVKCLIDFVKSSERGVVRWTK
jgi:UDP-N-acetylglucosamine acyltransferase